MNSTEYFTDFDSLVESLNTFPSASQHFHDRAVERQRQLTKPEGSLGKLETLAIWLASWQRQDSPRLGNVRTLIFAGNHGVTAQGVSMFPVSVTSQMVKNFEVGGAAINQLCKAYGSQLSVVALDLDQPTHDITKQCAMNDQECLEAVNRGWAAIPDEVDLLLLGEMGIGNTTISAALCQGLFGEEPDCWVGPGTGLDEPGLLRKKSVVAEVLELHRHVVGKPLEVLCALGGREQAAIVGAVLRARQRSIPVILDGYICCAAASVLGAIDRTLLDHCQFAHCSREPGHRKLLEKLGREAILDLDLRLGEGSGAALALGILRGAVACHNGMASFKEAGVDKKIRCE